MKIKQVLVISGKGGTGKTVLTGSLAELYQGIVVADCDVDAPDLHLLLKPSIKERYVFEGGKIAVIAEDVCTKCARCRSLCQFSAIDEDIRIEAMSCEGCCVCSWNCPAEAIKMMQKESGESYISEVSCGIMVHALLHPGEENSGKLVTEVKIRAGKEAKNISATMILVDGPPGIGCPVIASLGGVDLAVVITEPTKSGIHDMSRVIRTAQHFKVPVKVVVNKFDINRENTVLIEEYLRGENIEIFGKIPFSKKIVEAVRLGLPITGYDPVCKESGEIIKIKERLDLYIGGDNVG